MEFYFGTNGEGSLGVDRLLRVEPCGSVVVTSTAAIGATSPFARAPAKDSSPPDLAVYGRIVNTASLRR
jgi:hypothetical protein